MTAPFGIVVAAEDESDARRIKSLIDKVLIAEIAWLGEQPELLDDLREWRSHDAAASFLDIHGIHEIADARRLPSPHGYFDGRPAAQDYRSAVRAMWLLKAGGLPSALVWVRDTDGETSRITGWTDACAQAGEDFSVLVGGFPHECMEAWLLVALQECKGRVRGARCRRRDLARRRPKRPRPARSRVRSHGVHGCTPRQTGARGQPWPLIAH